MMGNTRIFIRTSKVIYLAEAWLTLIFRPFLDRFFLIRSWFPKHYFKCSSFLLIFFIRFRRLFFYISLRSSIFLFFQNQRPSCSLASNLNPIFIFARRLTVLIKLFSCKKKKKFNPRKSRKIMTFSNFYTNLTRGRIYK